MTSLNQNCASHEQLTCEIKERPVIGVSCGRYPLSGHGGYGQGISEPYIEALRKYGAIPLLIPGNLSQEEVRSLMSRLDAVLLTGGADVEPSVYGEERQPYCGDSDRRRDECEISIARAAVESDVPLLAICRGIQVLNVALGGNLYQDVVNEYDGRISHRAGRGVKLAHRVRVQPESLLCRCLNEQQLEVNSRHHQAVKRIAPSLQAVAWAEDELVEAVESPSKRFIIGVQWHPEDLIGEVEHAVALFRCFVEAARSTS